MGFTAGEMNKLYEAIGSEHRVIGGQEICADDLMPFIEFMWGVLKAVKEER